MAKRLDITPQIAAAIQAATKDPGLDVSKLAVYETVLADTNPIAKRGSLFDKGTLSVSLLQNMVDLLNTPATVPLQTMHDQGELPSGRVFSAWLDNNTPNGATELVGLFFIPLDRVQLVGDIESSVIDSVSIGIRAQKLLCSECGWDYMGADSSMMNFYDRTCANEHPVGTDGVHVTSVGLDQWYETSLVGQGGVPRAKIRSRAAAATSQAHKERLAASGIPLEATVLTATVKSPCEKSKGKSSMAGETNLDTLVTKLTESAGQVALLTNQNTTLAAEVTALKADVTAKDTKVNELTAQLSGTATGSVVATLNAEVATLKEAATTSAGTMSAVVAFLKDQAKLALTATNKSSDNLSDDPAALMEVIKASGLALHQTFAGAPKTKTEDGGTGEVTLNASAFTTRK